MTTSMISAALPAASSNKNHASTGSQGEADTSSPSFSSVLTSQQTPNAAPEAEAPAQAPAQNDLAQSSNPELPQAETTEDIDTELAELAGEQGLSLPQIALNIASEAALAMAARQPAARSAQAALPANAAALASHELLANASVKANPVQVANTALTSSQQNPLLQAALPAADAKLPASASANATPLPASASANATPLPAGFVPVLATAAPHQTELNARKPNLSANIRPALLAGQDQARTGSASLGKPAVDFSAAIASLADKAGITNTAQIDISAAQASSAANGSAAAHLAPLTGSTGSAFNMPAQTALPTIATPLQSPQWASDFGRQFISLTQGGHNMPHTAELRLDPPELGPLRISINISDNVAHAIFTSPHAAVRQTVENALPQLQQLLEQAGISLGQTSVNDQGQPEQSFSESSAGNRNQTAMASNGSSAATGDAAQPASRSRAPDALVDTFA